MKTPEEFAAPFVGHFGPAEGCTIRKSLEAQLVYAFQCAMEDAARDMRERAESACHSADSCRVACCNGCDVNIHALPLLPGGET